MLTRFLKLTSPLALSTANPLAAPRSEAAKADEAEPARKNVKITTNDTNVCNITNWRGYRILLTTGPPLMAACTGEVFVQMCRPPKLKLNASGRTMAGSFGVEQIAGGLVRRASLGNCYWLFGRRTNGHLGTGRSPLSREENRAGRLRFLLYRP